MEGRYTVRAVRADEWREVKDLRLAALSDEAAPIAFLQTYDVVAAYPDELWQERVGNSSVEAGEDASGRQFVAVAADGTWVGSALAMVERAGDVAFDGAVPAEPGGHVVGVYVVPGHRGRDALPQLLAAATDWVRKRGLPRIRLFVHEDNVRARRAYEKCGFRDTGTRITTHAGIELEMAVPLTSGDPGTP